MKIVAVKAIEILDSRGKPTIRTFIKLDDNSIHSSSVPSGASTGKYEAIELRDNDPKRFFGEGVFNAINNVNEIIAKEIIGMECEPKLIDQKMIDLDGSANKSKLGANAILSISQAMIKAASYTNKKPLWQFISEYYSFQRLSDGTFPQFMVNVVNGGKHANWNFDIQEFIIIPNNHLPSESIKTASTIFHHLQLLLKKMGLSTLVGDEGGYSPPLKSNEQVFELIIKAATNAGYKNERDYYLGIDAAASEFYSPAEASAKVGHDGQYTLKKDNRTITGEELTRYYLDLKEKYHIYSFEDIFDQDDWDNFIKFTYGTGTPVPFLIIGDDLYVTNPQRIKKGIELKATNAVLIKPNQIGTIYETIEAIRLAKQAGFKVIISHRSGETEDTFIADLAYGVGADYIKSGSMSRSERLAKYNRLIEIENKL